MEIMIIMQLHISSAMVGTVRTDTTPGRLMISTAAAGAGTVTVRMRNRFQPGRVGIGTTAPNRYFRSSWGYSWYQLYMANSSTMVHPEYWMEDGR